MVRRLSSLVIVFVLCASLLASSPARAATDLVLDFRFPPIVLPPGFSLNLDIPCNVGIEPSGNHFGLRATGDQNCIWGAVAGGIAVQVLVTFDRAYHVPEVEFEVVAPDFDAHRRFTLSVVLPDESESERTVQNYDLSRPRRVTVNRTMSSVWAYFHTGSFSGVTSLWMVTLRIIGAFPRVPTATPTRTFTPSATPTVPTNTPFVGAWLPTRAPSALPICPNTPTPTGTRLIAVAYCDSDSDLDSDSDCASCCYVAA